MRWLAIGLVFYLAIGVGVLIFKGGQIIDEQSGELYDQRGTGRFKVFLIIVLTAVISLWPIVLLREEKSESRRLYVTKQVLEEFKRVADERGENIDGLALALIASKFVRVYESMGRLMYREHLKYELEKYLKEGLRQDYIAESILKT